MHHLYKRGINRVLFRYIPKVSEIFGAIDRCLHRESIYYREII